MGAAGKTAMLVGGVVLLAGMACAALPPVYASVAAKADAQAVPRLRAAGPAEALDARAFQKGIAYTGYWHDAYVGGGARTSLRRLRASGATWVEILVTGYVRTIHSTRIVRRSDATPTDASLRATIALAHQLGLKVLLKPHVDPWGTDDRWRGEIGPGFAAAEWAAWFASYRVFIVHYAALAAESGVEQFCVGCELDGTVHRKADWRAVIAAVRGVFPRTITYADDQIEEDPDAVQWWDAVDLIGMDAYPVLSGRLLPTIATLERGWRRWTQRLEALSRRWDKPVILTEIGCRSVRGAARVPWDWQRRGPVDLEVQKRWYAAAFKGLGRRPWLIGMYWWQWEPDPSTGGPRDTGYSPHRKPAEAVLRAWYSRVL
jgi:hypothetical protein